jgi:hypothetical protein
VDFESTGLSLILKRTSVMKLELNNKEWLAIYGLLERYHNNDKHLTEIHNRMKITLNDALNTHHSAQKQTQFANWFSTNTEKIKEMSTSKTIDGHSENHSCRSSTLILSDD